MAWSACDVDSWQRKHPAVGFPLAVVYKFFDDQGNYLAAALTYYAFVAIFPLLLIASSVLGFVLQGDPALEQRLLSSALSQFPIVGEQLGRPQGLHGSTSAVVVGAIAALYGALGVGQAGQNAMNIVWSVPRNTRPDPFMGRLRSLVVLAAAGLGLMGITVVTGFTTNVSLFGADLGVLLDWLVRLASVVLTALVLAIVLHLSTASSLGVRAALPGAVVVSVLWHALQLFGGIYVRHVVAKATSVNAVFALVLGLLVLIYLAAVCTLLGAEVNVVRERRLYPRALLTPFTDDVELTRADRRAYRYYARAQRHKGFQTVHVTFDRKPPDDEDEQPEPAQAHDP